MGSKYSSSLAGGPQRSLTPSDCAVDQGVIVRAIRRVLLVALIVALVLQTLVSASNASSSERVIRVIARFSSGNFEHDAPPVGPSRGDVVVGEDVLTNAVRQFGRAKGVVIGRDHYRVRFESSTAGVVDLTAALPGGIIRCRGRARSIARNNVLRIVATSGVFAGTRGICEAKELSTMRTMYTYRLRG